jgi:aminopeptidase N
MLSARGQCVRLGVMLAGLVILGLGAVAPADAGPGSGSGALPTEPVWYPPTKAGWPGAWLNPRDPSAYLAFHQAAAMRAKAGLREEPTPNQALYDARYYALDLSLNPAAKILTGTVTMRLTITGGPLTQIDLDLANNMVVDSLFCAGAPTTFTHTGAILRVDLDRAYATGENATLVIRYRGDPAGDAFGWDTADHQPMIWTLSEAFGARTWWPCKDYPDDKADSVDVRVSVPTGLITVSNGKLRGQSDNGTRAFSWWHESVPITTYLVSLAIHPYHVYTDWYRSTSGDSTEISFYNFQSSIPRVEPVQAKVKNMMGIFAARFGAYPFASEKYGHAEFLWPGGMEHQTCTSLGSSAFGEWIIAHELTHQWWGDMVTCSTFHDIWLNEGFATYGEAIYAEALGGPAAYFDEMRLAQYFGGGTLYVPSTDDWTRIFDRSLTYNKASWVPHMLRGVMGDSTFFAALRAYGERFAYRSASTADFATVMSEVAGRDLRPMINRWIMGEGYPIYRYDWTETADGAGWAAQVRLRQVQDTPVFPMPVRLVVHIEDVGGDSLRTFAVESTGRDSTYTLKLPRRPLRVEVDPDEWILRRVMPPIPTPAFTRPLLVVNGVPWGGETGPPLRAAYEKRAFTAGYDFDFWDNQTAPDAGYPASVPAPVGHGSVPGEVLAQYRTVLWVGNNFGDDRDRWIESPVLGYLEAGGNVLLLAPSARTFLLEPFRAWLGVTWAEGDSAVSSGRAMVDWLPDLPVVGTQNAVSFFRVEPGTARSEVLFADRGVPTRAFALLGPPGGAANNPARGRFALIGGRPYRWNTDNLRVAMEAVLSRLLPPVAADARLAVRQSEPNPFRDRAKVAFFLPEATTARLDIFDVSGRRIRTLRDSRSPAGESAEVWDGRDADGHSAASGIYFVRLDAGGKTATGRLVRIR